MTRQFDHIFVYVENYIRCGDFIGAARVLEQESNRLALGKETRAECLYWLGTCCVARASELVHGDPFSAKSLFEKAEVSFRNALVLSPHSVRMRVALGRLLLTRHKPIRDVLECLVPLADIEDIHAESDDTAFRTHSLQMLLGTAYCLDLQYELGIERYRRALSRHYVDAIKEPDLSSFVFFGIYGVIMTSETKSEILQLAHQFRAVNSNALQILQEIETE
jgi:hypothetical protein